MSDEVIKRDNNSVPVAAGIDTNGDIKMLRVDPVTHRLLIDIDFVSEVSAPTFPTALPRDNNAVPVSGAVTDDSNQTPRPLIIDSRNGYLFCDVYVE